MTEADRKKAAKAFANRLVCLGNPCYLSEDAQTASEILVTVTNEKESPNKKKYPGNQPIDIGDLLRKGNNRVTLDNSNKSLSFNIYAVDLYDKDSLQKLVGYDLMLAYVEADSANPDDGNLLRLMSQISSLCQKLKKQLITREQLRNQLNTAITDFTNPLPHEITSLVDDLRNDQTILDSGDACNRAKRLYYKRKKHNEIIAAFKLALTTQEPNAGEALAEKARDSLGFAAASLLTQLETEQEKEVFISYSSRKITIDFSKVLPLAKDPKKLPFVSERQRDWKETKNQSKETKNKPKNRTELLFCYNQTNKERNTEQPSVSGVFGSISCIQSSYSHLINRLFKQNPLQVEFAYLLIYLSVALGRNLSLLDRISFPNICQKLGDLNGNPKASQKIEDLATQILDISSFRIDPKLSYFSLLNEGWHFRFDSPENENNFSKYYNSTHAKTLERTLLKAKKPDEYSFFFRGNNGINSTAAKDILMAISTISPSVDFCGQSEPDISFEITFSPLFVACSDNVNKSLDKIISRSKREYKRFSTLDLRVFLGKQARLAREGKHVFTMSFSADQLLEREMVNEAIDAGLIEETSENTYCFAQKYIRILMDSYYTAHLTDQKHIELAGKSQELVSNIVSEIFNFSKQKDPLSHLEFSLAEPSLFALSMLKEVSPHLRESIIKELIKRAQNYQIQSGNRLQQELSAHILCYVLATDPNLFQFDLTKDAFVAACSRQFYPGQAILLREMMKKNAFFRNYPVEQFKKGLITGQDNTGNYVFMHQPAFYFYQTFCKEELLAVSKLESFWDQASRAQYESWITKDFMKAKICLRNAYQKTICNLDSTSFDISIKGDDAAKNIYSMQLWLYALSNIYNPASEYEAETFITRDVLGITQDQSPQQTIKHIISMIFYAEFFQKKQNPNYPMNLQDVTLICGAFRFFNTFAIETTVTLPPEAIKQYIEWMKQEDKTSRYYWFQRRLISYYTFDSNSWDESPEEYTTTAFLRYDNFPQKYQAFIKNPRRLVEPEKE